MKIFISYSHNDIKIKNEIKEILLELKQDGYINEIWDDEEIRHGDEFDKKIFDNLVDSDIALFIVTHNLWKSNYISNVEIPLANKFFYKYSYPKIVPIIIEKEAFNKTYFPALNNKDAIPQKDKNLIFYNKSNEKEAKELLKKNLINLINYIKSLPKREKSKIDFYKFNKNLEKIDKYVQRKQRKDLIEWIESSENIAYIEGEEGVGKSVLAQKFGEYLWEKGYFVKFLRSNEWKGQTNFEEFLEKYLEINLTYDNLKKFKKDIVFILDGVNERENFDKVERLLIDFEEMKNCFEIRGIPFKIKLLFTTRELINYGLSSKWEKYHKILLGQYDDNEFCEAVELYFDDLNCNNFPKNIKEMAKYPSFFELTIKLKNRLKNIENITKELLYWEKLKWMIEEDENFKNKLNITNLNDIESKLCKFLDKTIDKKLLGNIFEKDYSQIKSALKEGRIVIKEGGDKVQINNLILSLSYALYLMTKAKDLALNNSDFKIIEKDLEKFIEPIKSDISSEIFFTVLVMYANEKFDNKDLILFTFYYMWLNHQNSKVSNEKLEFIAKNLFKTYIEYLDLLETHQIRSRFIDFDIHLIKILKYLWKENKFQELENYVYNLNNNDIEEIKRKIAIVSSDVTQKFLEKINEILNNDKKNETFFKIWNILRISVDGKLISYIKEKNLKQIYYVLNREDLLNNIMEATHTENVFKYLNNWRHDHIEDGAGYFPCLDFKFTKNIIYRMKNFLKIDNIEYLGKDFLNQYFSFFAYYDKSFLLKIIKNLHNKFSKFEIKNMENLREIFNCIYLNEQIDYFEKIDDKILSLNMAIESSILQTNKYQYLIDILINKNFRNFLLKDPNVFMEINVLFQQNKELIEKIEEIFEKYLEIKFSKIKKFLNKFIKEFNTDIEEETLLFYLSIGRTKKYKDVIKKYLLHKLFNTKDPSIYFYLLKINFEFKEYIFEIINFDNKIDNDKKVLFSTVKDNRKLIDYLIDTQNYNFFELLKENQQLFEDKRYHQEKGFLWDNYIYLEENCECLEEPKIVFDYKGISYLLLNRANDLLEWGEDLLKLDYNYLRVLKVYDGLKKIKELNCELFLKIFEYYFSLKEKIFSLNGKDIDNFYEFEFDLLKIMYEIDKNKSLTQYLKFVNNYEIYNDFTEFMFSNTNDKKFFELIFNNVKNDYEIMLVSLLFLKNNKKDILLELIEKILKSENSFKRQIGISYLRWFGDDESLEKIKYFWKNDNNGYVRYFAEFSYYVCLKEKNFKKNFIEAMKKEDLQEFSINLLSIRECISPLSLITLENFYKENKILINNFDFKKGIFYQKFVDKLNESFSNKFQVFGQTLKNYIAGEEIDKYKKIILDL